MYNSTQPTGTQVDTFFNDARHSSALGRFSLSPCSFDAAL